jgi:hypothetical protein
MNNRETSPCEQLFEYLTGESSDMQRKRFEKHLASCSTCKEEVFAWREVWDRLADDIELIDPPADLKEAVLSPLFDSDDLLKNPIKKIRRPWLKQYLRRGIGVAVLLFVFMAGWMLREFQIQSFNKEASIPLPSNIETLFRLTAEKDNGKFQDSPRAYGVACLVRSEGKEQLVIYVFGSPQTLNDEAYQVWLWNNGQRTSAGTFTVGSSGIGIMTLAVADGKLDFDAVGVTLEPDSHSSTPRGPKMFDSSEKKPAGTA